MRFLVSFLTILLLVSCTNSRKNQVASTSNIIPFSYFEKTFIVVPVTINDSIHTNFILDTGIGLNLISKSICEKLACQITGKHTGQRMSGQEVTVSMSTVKSLSMASRRLADVPVGVFDIEKLMPGSDIGGFLSLGFFKETVFTVDYKKQVIGIEDLESLREIKSKGTTVPIKLDIQDHAVGILMPVVLPNGQKISAEVDTGSQALILNERFMKPLRISPQASTVKRQEGQDETDHKYMRYFTKLDKGIHLPNAIEMSVAPMEVMFQKIIYDGLVGHYFLEQFTVTYNLPESQMIFRKPHD